MNSHKHDTLCSLPGCILFYMGTQNQTIILIAPGFDLEPVAAWTIHLRSSGSPVTLAGLTSGPLRSSQGVRLLPDADLDRLSREDTSLVLLPGGSECIAAFIRDPRVLQLLQAVQGTGGRIAAVQTIQEAIPDISMTVLPGHAGADISALDVLDTFRPV